MKTMMKLILIFIRNKIKKRLYSNKNELIKIKFWDRIMIGLRKICLDWFWIVWLMRLRLDGMIDESVIDSMMSVDVEIAKKSTMITLMRIKHSKR